MINSKVIKCFLVVIVLISSSCDDEKEASQMQSSQREGRAKSVRRTSALDAELDYRGVAISSDDEDVEPLIGTGQILEKPDAPAYVERSLGELKRILQKAKSDDEAVEILYGEINDIWEKNIDKKFFEEGMGLTLLFEENEELVRKIENGEGELSWDEGQLRAAYTTSTILRMFSETDNLSIGGVFSDRMDDPSVKDGDILLVKMMENITPFRGEEHSKNLEFIDSLREARNPAYRGLSVMSAKKFIKEKEELLGFLREAVDDEEDKISQLALLELRRINVEESWEIISDISKKYKDRREEVALFSSDLLENRR